MKALVLFPSMLVLATASAQNLVLNPSFEEYTECPDNVAQATRATGWEQNTLTPDYFNACSTQPEVDVPFNNFGVQEAYSGSAYVGMIAFADSFLVPEHENFRERIGTYLSTPLLVGAETYVSFRLGIAAFGPQPVQAKWSCKGYGAKFMMGPMDLGAPPPPPTNDAQVCLTHVPTQPQSWTLVSGVFVPDSAYEYLVLGNFFSDSLSTPFLIDANGNYGVAYVYVDDVCVSQTLGVCAMDLGVRGRSQASRVSAAYDPSRGILLFGLPPMEAIDLDLFSLSGQRTFSTRLASAGAMTAVPSPPLATGIYVLRLRSAHMERAVRLVVQSP